MVKTKRAAMTLVLGMLLVLFSTAFAAAPTQTYGSRTASAPPSQQVQVEWSGWSEVPGNGLTVSGPATTNYYGKNYVFVRGTNNHIYVNTLNGATWSGWSEVPGHGLTLRRRRQRYLRLTLATTYPCLPETPTTTST